MRTSCEKVRISDEAERVQSVSYYHIRLLSGLYTVMCLREGKRGPFATVMCKVPCFQRGPTATVMYKQATLLSKGPQQQLQCANILLSKGPKITVTYKQ